MASTIAEDRCVAEAQIRPLLDLVTQMGASRRSAGFFQKAAHHGVARCSTSGGRSSGNTSGSDRHAVTAASAMGSPTVGQPHVHHTNGVPSCSFPI